MIDIFLILQLFTPPFETFWVAVGAVGSIVIAINALAPIRKHAEQSLIAFEDAIQIDISVDGVFNVYNICNDAVLITEISQLLVTGTKLGISPDAKSKDIVDKIKNISFDGSFTKKEVRRKLVQKTSFTYSGTLTHLPSGMENEAVWFVKTKITFTSMSGEENEYSVVHRFSKELEPRLRWVEYV